MLPPFKALCTELGVLDWEKDSDIAQIDKHQFMSALRLILVRHEFDEEWYVSVNSDVRDAIEAGIFSSGKDHYIEYGYFEGRAASKNKPKTSGWSLVEGLSSATQR